ncbi:MAG: MliC family protein [Methylobacillus sp.]|nr:MliC family protein [Methylobacillus sp.]
MNHKIASVSLIAGLLLGGCQLGGMFGGNDSPGQPKRLIGATEYQCENGKRFHVRLENNGATAWLIHPDRELALAKQVNTTRYSNGATTLEINDQDATLKDDPNVTYSGCKAAVKAEGKS